MIEIKNIRKSFGEKEVLKGISTVFEQGKTNLIIGASGTGKSVLLKNIVGLIPPDSGEILFDGRNLYESNLEETKNIRREIGMLFQASALFDSKTVEENVMFPLDMFSQMSKEEKLERVNFCLERVGLQNVNKLMPSEISGGMQKRVGIARAIALRPRYLFCDEPNSGLDPQTAVTIDELISEITHEYDITTVVVTHDMNSVMGMGEHILFLYQGHMIWEGSSDIILDTQTKELQDFIFSGALVKSLKQTR